MNKNKYFSNFLLQSVSQPASQSAGMTELQLLKIRM